jgi:hypothetical protein
VVSDDVLAKIKPEEGKGSEDPALLWDATGDDHIEGRNPVGSHDEELVTQVINISYLSSFEKLKTFQIGMKYYVFHLPYLTSLFISAAPPAILDKMSTEFNPPGSV